MVAEVSGRAATGTILGFALKSVDSGVSTRGADHFSGIQPEKTGKLIDGADGDL
jgi:hypothetical protein